MNPALAPPPPPDTRSATQLAQAAWSSPMGWVGPTKLRPMKASTVVPIIPVSWTVPNWYIDPANSSGCASDSNSGTSATCSAAGSGIGPLVTFQELNVHRWGCMGNPAACPRIQQDTTIQFLSSQSTGTDAVYLRPGIEMGTRMHVTGTLRAATSGTLSGTVARNRSAAQLQQETLAAGLTAGEMLWDTTHPGIAWTYKNPSGTNWTLSQPLTPHVFPDGVMSPTEVTSFADGDAYTIYLPSNLNLVNATPSIGGFPVVYAPQLIIDHFTFVSPGGGYGALGQLTIGAHVAIYESTTATVAITRMGNVVTTGFDGLSNVYSGTATSMEVTGPIETSGVWGGALVGYDNSLGLGSLGVILDGDVILNTYTNAVTSVQIGTLYIDTAGSLDVFGASAAYVYLGTPILWGPGVVNVKGHLGYPAGATGGATTFVTTGGINLSEQTKGCIVEPASASVGACNTAAATGANLDIALGAASGCLTAIGNGALCNYGVPW